MKNPFIDLFAGCGGLSLGLEQAGFHPVYVNELNTDALNTYLINRSEYKHLSLKEFHSNDIKELSGSKKKLEELSKNLKSKFNIKKGEVYKYWEKSQRKIFENNKFYVQAGAGIVADSKPINEYEETVNKAKALINALR